MVKEMGLGNVRVMFNDSRLFEADQVFETKIKKGLLTVL